MTIEQQPLPDEKIALQEQTTKLARELCNFANLNPRFKKATSDYVRIEAEEAERSEPESLLDEDDNELECDFSGVPEASFVYKFEAIRYRRYEKEDNQSRQRASAMFILSVIGINKHVFVPPHIAEEAIGLPGPEAVREIGPVSLQATTTFTVSTETGNFSVCDHAVYLDMDGDPLHEAPCSCENNVLVYDPEFEVDETDDTPTIIGLRQRPSFDLLEKSKNETVVYDDIDFAVKEWEDMIHVGERIDADMYKERLQRAFLTLDSVQRAIWTQAGLSDEQQRNLRARLQRS